MKEAISPIQLTLEPGRTYLWCQCGLSRNQPFCDNSHAGTTIQPKVFSVYTRRTVWLCVCKRTRKVPYCDGSHLNPNDKTINNHGSTPG
ncbi:MAG TPA: CDGSH iron-sulfur domain-containing protein [Ohtaekwangia sp.]|nr:CDGSH iron-sulfur domain-containing protein [Ohtaekwangia sp.]